MGGNPCATRFPLSSERTHAASVPTVRAAVLSCKAMDPRYRRKEAAGGSSPPEGGGKIRRPWNRVKGNRGWIANLFRGLPIVLKEKFSGSVAHREIGQVIIAVEGVAVRRATKKNRRQPRAALASQRADERLAVKFHACGRPFDATEKSFRKLCESLQIFAPADPQA